MLEVKVRVEKQIGSGVLSFETGYLAKQAAATVVVQYGETVVLSAVATGPSPRKQDFFPLTCDYRERTAAAGKFPGGFNQTRRPTDPEGDVDGEAHGSAYSSAVSPGFCQ